MDELVKNEEIVDTVFAQIGQSNYTPKYFEYKRFLDYNEFKEYQTNADIIISHAGTGALIGALKLKKQVIAVPRLAKYGEHIDDHQMQVAGVLEEEGYLKMVLDMERMSGEIYNLRKKPITKTYNRPSNVLEIIDNYIEKNL